MGLGLAIVREVALRHGGSADVLNLADGSGCAFRLCLPCLQVRPTRVDDRQTEPGEARRISRRQCRPGLEADGGDERIEAADRRAGRTACIEHVGIPGRARAGQRQARPEGLEGAFGGGPQDIGAPTGEAVWRCPQAPPPG